MEKVLLESEDSDENNNAFFVFCLSSSKFHLTNFFIDQRRKWRINATLPVIGEVVFTTVTTRFRVRLQDQLFSTRVRLFSSHQRSRTLFKLLLKEAMSWRSFEDKKTINIQML